MTANESGAPFIQLKGVTKRFGSFTAVDNVDLSIQRGELFSILGGSGCGKTTLLRMLAGFEAPSAGEILLDGENITALPPFKRPVNMMFQSYALFPHMTVADNVAYGLKKERVEKSQRDLRVNKMLTLVQLEDYAARKPDQLSGGQRQRVALARALIKEPKVLLLDEPLAALDKKLREQTQFELMNIQDKLGITFIVVTHDQEEAMILSTRIAVMKDGRFEQIGQPKEIYEYPKNRFVANFIGTINMFDGVVTDVDDDVVSLASDDSSAPLVAVASHTLRKGDAACIAVRPEKMQLSKDQPDTPDTTCVSGIIEDLGYFGNLSLYRVRLDSGKILHVSAQNRRRTLERQLEWDDTVYVSWHHQSTVLLDSD